MAAVDSWRIGISLFCGCLALSFNSLLGYVILTTRSSLIGKYQHLLFLYTLSAAVFAAGQILTAGNFLMTSDGYVFYDSIRVLPLLPAQIVLFIYVSCFIQNIVILTLAFIYRYFAVCRPEDLDNFFQHWKGILLFSVTITASEMAALIYALGPSPVTEAVFQGPFYQAIGFNVDETAYMGAVIFINNRLNWKLFLVLCFFGMLTFIGGVIMVTLAVKIGKTLKTNAGESATLAQHQKKIFTLLIFQLSLPVFFNILPQQVIIISLYLNISSEEIVSFFGCILTIAQIIDPLLMFYFIKPYHMALLGIFCKRRANQVGNSHSQTANIVNR